MDSNEPPLCVQLLGGGRDAAAGGAKLEIKLEKGKGQPHVPGLTQVMQLMQILHAPLDSGGQQCIGLEQTC